MKSLLLACVLAVAGACGSEREPALVTTSGTIEFRDIEGGVWVIRTDRAVYDPRNLGQEFKVNGAGVQVTLTERRDIAGVGVGIAADIVSISLICALPNPAGCISTGCQSGFACDTRPQAGCASSACTCDFGARTWTCTPDCNGGTCVQVLQ
jgi:hypothetical protein